MVNHLHHQPVKSLLGSHSFCCYEFYHDNAEPAHTRTNQELLTAPLRQSKEPVKVKHLLHMCPIFVAYWSLFMGKSPATALPKWLCISSWISIVGGFVLPYPRGCCGSCTTYKCQHFQDAPTSDSHGVSDLFSYVFQWNSPAPKFPHWTANSKGTWPVPSTLAPHKWVGHSWWGWNGLPWNQPLGRCSNAVAVEPALHK